MLVSEETGELLEAAGDGEAGLFYSSIPDTSPQFVGPAAEALAGLTVD